MAAIRATIRGKEQVIKNFGMKKLQMEAASVRWVDSSKKTLFRKVSGNISLTCHSLADLAAMDPPHPYAIHHLNNPHSPYYQIHMQSGQMRARLESDTAMDTQDIRGGVGFTEEAEQSLKAPGSTHSYLRCVIFGTNFVTKAGHPAGMVSRDFLNGSLNEIKGEVQNRLIKDLSRAVRRKV